MVLSKTRRFAALLLIALAIFAPWAAKADGNKPRRIVSLNLCADELVLRLADRERIAAVTWLSRDPNNTNVVDLAADVPINHGLAEEIVPLDPDLVIAGTHTTRTAVALLKRAGFPLIELGVPRTLDEVRVQIRTVANAVGEPERGERLIADMDIRLAALPRVAPGKRLRALVLNPNGFTAGADSLVDKIITAAGLENLAPRLGVGNYGHVPLETVVTSRPDVLILNDRRDGPPSLATVLLQHPALAGLADHAVLAVLPARLWNCGGPGVIEAIERLSRIASRSTSARAGE
ncbi:MAG TPA: ABC transporter substrate-binding protein [Xanthobacteraceae bacterium]|nr:ABC transporter substrate-binding protein [Xanthobacteraceae bacterium]